MSGLESFERAIVGGEDKNSLSLLSGGKLR